MSRPSRGRTRCIAVSGVVATAVAGLLTLSSAASAAWQAPKDVVVHAPGVRPPVMGRYLREAAGGGHRPSGKAYEILALNRDFTVHHVYAATDPGKDPVVEFGRWGVRDAGIAVTFSHRNGAPLPEPERVVFTALGMSSAGAKELRTVSGDHGAVATLAYSRAPALEVGKRVEALVTRASEGDMAGVAGSLAAGVPIDAVNERGWTPLIAAARNGEARMVRFLARKGANPNAAAVASGYTPLMAAVEFGDAAIVSYLLSRQANPNAATSGGGTALMIAAANKFGDEDNNLGIVKTLVRAGADVCAEAKSTDSSGVITAISLATARKALRIAAYLRSVGAK